MIYPWHRNAWRQLAEHWQQQPNAWLLAGRENTGKTEFARSLAQALLCEKPQADHSACGHCPSCHLFEQDSHPDFYLLEPDQTEGESGARRLQQIKIDAVRAILEPLTHSSLRGNRRVVMIVPAESMNLQAANALLKMLEEPPEAVVFLLVSHQRDRLLPTIRSRCRQLLNDTLESPNARLRTNRRWLFCANGAAAAKKRPRPNWPFTAARRCLTNRKTGRRCAGSCSIFSPPRACWPRSITPPNSTATNSRSPCCWNGCTNGWPIWRSPSTVCRRYTTPPAPTRSQRPPAKPRRMRCSALPTVSTAYCPTAATA